ncbi:MAG TPA: ATP-binding protein, partial [Anaerolineae bacterium]|nr:ATP-binding protein [Anaerolineae bacterium]
EHLLLSLNVPPARLDQGSTEVGATVDVLTAYRMIYEAGGLVIAPHANSTHGVAMRDFPFGGQTKIAYTQDPHLHALEVTDLESRSRRATARFFNGSKPEYPRRMHCIQGSDAHRLHGGSRDRNNLGIGERVTEILLPEVSFEALKAVFEGNDFAVTRPARPSKRAPYDHVTAAREQGPSIVQSFHESMNRRGGRLYAILCDVAAFANTNGGTVYVGVSASKKGIPAGIDKPEEAVSILRTEIQRKLTPPLDVEIDVLESQGRPIIRINVPEGPDKPYCLDDYKIYVRQESETSMAVRDEIVRLVQQTLQRQKAKALVPSAEGVIETGMEPVALAQKVPETAADTSVDRVPPPKVGVQVVAVEERKGTRYYSLLDLRNNSVVHNVTRKAARRLWNYALAQHESNPVDPAKVQWAGNIGLWQVARRAKKMRYDLVRRLANDRLEVYYGVTEEGMEGPWRQFLRGEDANGE